MHIVLLPKEEGDNFYLVKNSSKVKSEPPAPQNYAVHMNGNSDFIAICCTIVYYYVCTSGRERVPETQVSGTYLEGAVERFAYFFSHFTRENVKISV